MPASNFRKAVCASVRVNKITVADCLEYERIRHIYLDIMRIDSLPGFEWNFTRYKVNVLEVHDWSEVEVSQTGAW